MQIDLKVYGFMSNEYRLLPIVITRKVCDILQMEYQWLKHDMNANFPDSCPIAKVSTILTYNLNIKYLRKFQGHYYLKDYSVDVSRFPKKPWNINDYKINARVYFRKEEEIVLDLYIITTDNDEYVV